MTFKPRVDPNAVQKVLEGLLSGTPSSPCSGEDSVCAGFSKLPDGNIAYQNLTYREQVIPIVVLKNALFTDSAGNVLVQSQDAWIPFLTSPQQGQQWNLPDGEALFQCLHREYTCRADPRCAVLAQERLPFWQATFQKYWLMTSTGIAYKPPSLEAVITPRTILHPSASSATTLAIPEPAQCVNANYGYVVLAKKQSLAQLGQVETVTPDVARVLKELFGAGYIEAGAVFQYVSPLLPDGNLREVRLYVPTLHGRTQESKRVLSLGVDVINNYFGIYAGGGVDYSWPALGVRVAPNTP